jgi:hypothetical protein
LNGRRVIAILVGAAVIGGLWWWLSPSDVRQIEKLVRTAAEAASWSPGTGSGLEKLAGANRLVGCCTEDVVVATEGMGPRARTLQGVEEVRQAVLAARTSGVGLSIGLDEISVEVTAERTTGVAQFLARIHAGEAKEPWLLEVRVQVRKTAEGWRIARVEPVKGFGA